MEMTDAARVTDVYSALAASFAVDTQELAEAMSKTASGIASVGVSFESASAMITTITAATRESASVIGSSLKSLSARYGSIKTDPSALVDAEGQEISLNKIDKALKSIGVSIKDANGQLRDMDDVVLELGEKWNTLNRNEQRFVATAFAGNLQSNRFLALVSNIDEYKKALEVANDSEGTGALQFNKTLDNIETRLTKLKTAWQLFYTDSGIEKAIKNVITGLTNILNGLNKLPKASKKIPVSALMQIAVIIKGVKALALLIVLQIQKAIQQVKNAADNAIKGTSQNAQTQVLTLSEKIKKLKNDWQGMTGVQRGAKIAPYASMIGAGLSIAGSASNNLTAGTVMSGAGSIISGAASGLTMTGSWIGAGVGALVGVIKLISDLSSLEERKAEQKLEELKQAADEAENKRLESKQTVSGLEDYVKQYQEMAKAQYDSNDAKQQFLDLNAEIAEKYPDLLIQYDAEGNRIIKLTELQKKLNEEKAGYRENVWDSAKADYEKVVQNRNNNNDLFNLGKSIVTTDAGNKGVRKFSILGQISKDFFEEYEALFPIFYTTYGAGDSPDKYYQLISSQGPAMLADLQKISNFYKDNKTISTDAQTVLDNFIDKLQSYLNNNEVLQQQKTSAQSIMSSTFHYGDDTFEAYSPIYQAGKNAGFDLDQYIGNIMGSYDEETYKALIADEKEWAKRAQELAEGFQEAYLNNPEDAKFIGDIQNQSQADIKKFIDKDGIDSQINYQKYLKATWEEIENNLTEGLNYINEKLMENGLVVGEENAYGDLSSYITNSNISLWRGIVENDKEHFDTYYQMVANLASSNSNLSIKDITDTILQSDLSTMTGIAELRKTLKTKGAWSEDSEIESLLKQAESMVKINPALEFAAMFDTYKKAYEELDKLASSLSTGLELKDAISWATKMGKSINEFTQKEGKFYVSQEQFWNYVNTQLPLLNDMINQTDEFYKNLEVDESGQIVGKEGSGIDANQLEIIQGLYESWRNDKNKGDLATFIKEQKDNVSAEASSALKALLESYAIQSIQAFGRISDKVRGMLRDAGFTDDAIKAMENKYLGAETTSTLFSTGKIDVANWDKLPEKIQLYVNKTTGQITNYGKALEALATGIEEGTIDPSYASIYAEAVNSARNDLEDALEGTLDGARASTERVAKLIENGVLILNKKTGKYGYDLSSTTGYNQAMFDLYELDYTTTQAIQKVTESVLSQGTDVSKIQNPLFTSEYQYQLSQARQEAVEGLQSAVFDATKSFDISTLYKNNTTVSSKLNDLADKGAVRIEKDGEKVSLRILTTTIKNISSLIDTLAGGTDTSQNKASILSTINSYLKSAQEGTLDREIAEWLLAQLPDGTQFKEVFELTAGGYRAKNIQDLRMKIAEQTTELNKDITLTVSQFQSQLEDYLSAGYTLEQAIAALGVKVGTVADIIKGNFSDNNKIAQYQRAIYSTYQGAMDNIYSAMIDGLSNPSGAEIDLTKARQLGGEAYDNLKEMITVVETETGEAFGYLMDANQSSILAMMRNLAIGGNSTVADKLAEFYNTIAQMITDGMNGDLSATNIEWLQKAFKLTDRMFVKAGTSFRLTEEGARRIYTTMNGIDAIAGNLSLSVFAKSLQEVDYKLQSVSAVSKEIVTLQEEIIKAHGDKRKALENELALYQEILKVNQQNASSFNIMNNPIMGGAGNAIEAYKGLAQARQAIADMKTTNEYGMNVMDPTNAFRLAEISEQNLMALLKNGKNMVDVYAALGKSMRDIGGNFVIDMSNVASALEISFDDLGTAFGDGSNTAIQKIAQVQVDMLDAQINMLEGIVAMEDLTIEENTAGPINLDNWITTDKDGNTIDKAKQLGGMLGQVAKEVEGIENEVVTINQNTGENITFGNIIDALNSGKDGFETYLNSLPLEVRKQVDVFINNILTELKKLDFNTVNTGEENLQSFNLVKDMFRNMFGIKEDGTIDLGEGEEITPNIKVTIKTDGTSYYIEGDETPYADLTELGTALAAKLGVEGLTIPEDPFSQSIPMDSKPNVNITCSPEGKWFVNGVETTEENLPTAIRNAMSIDQQNIGTNNDTVYGNDDVLVKMGVNAATSYILGNQEGDEESVKTALKESASLNNQSVGSDDATLTGDINATVNTSIHFDGTNYTADGIDGTFDTKDKVADAIADKYKVDSRTLKEQIGKYNIPVNGSLDISFQTITPSYIVNGEILGTYDEATDAIAAGYEIESKTLPEKTTDLDLPVNSTLDVSFQTVAPSYTVGDKVSSTFDEAADAIGTRAGIEDKKLDPKTITVTQDTIVNFKATLKDAEGNPIQEDNGLDTGIDVKIVPNLGGFSTALWELIQKQEYDVSISPVIANGMELGKAIQQAIDDRQYTVQINPTWPNHGGYTDGSTIQSFNPDGKKKSSSSTKSTNFTGVGSNVKEVDGANNLVLLDDALKTLASSFQTAADNAGTFSKGLEGIVPSSVALRASSAKSALVELGTTTSSTITDLTTIFNKIEELIKKLQEGLPTAAKGNVALAKGSNDALATGTLMGELGPELWVSGGHYYIAGQSGAEFVNLPDDAIVFNHLQTRSLLANGNTTRGRAIGGEDRAVAFAKGSPEGPARASASDTLERLKALRAVWQSLLDLPASDLSKKAGGGGGGGGGAEDYKTFTADLERWYNLLRQIANYEQKITYEQKQRENFKHGQEYVDSLEKELKYLEKQADAYAVLSELQKSYYDQRRKDLNDTQYGKLIFTYTEDGLMQYLDDVVDANGNRQSRGLAILAELNRQSNEKGQSYWDKEGKNLYTGSFKVNGKQTIKGSSGGAAAQLMYLKSVGFDLNELLYNSEGGSNVGKNASETATNMMQTFFDNVDGWMEELDSLYDSYHEYLENIEDNTAAQQKILQEYIDNQMSVEDKLLKAITDRQQKIIDTLKDQIDIIQEAGQEYTQGLSEALSKERNLYNENKDDAELASKMRRLGILKRTGASASEIKALQNEIDNQLQENYFDAQQKQIDAIQEAIDTQLETLNQQLEVMEEALNYQKENGLLWAEVYEMMTKWTPEAMLNFIETYTSSYRENSQQKNSEDSKETLKQLEIWAASRGFDFSREPHKGNSKDYTKPNTSNDVAAPDMPRPSGGTTTGGGTSGSGSGSGTSTMTNGLAAPQEIDVENTGVYEDRTLTPTVRQVSKSDVIDIYKVGGYYTKEDGTHARHAWEVNGKLPAGKYYDFNGEIYRNPGAKHRRIIYSATSGKVYYVYDNTYLPNAKKISSYSSGGMNYSTGMAMLHGTSSKPEAILNASDTKLFREKLFGNGDFSLRQAIATIDLLRDQIASTTNNNSSVDFNGVTINISSDVIANDYDAQRAGRNIFDEMIKLSRKSTMLGVSRR